MPAVARLIVADVIGQLLISETGIFHVLVVPVLDGAVVEYMDGKQPIADKLTDDLAVLYTAAHNFASRGE